MRQHAHVTVPRALLARDIHGYDDESNAAKQAFHREGVKFLRSFAKALGLPTGSYDVRSNKGGIAVSGEVTLHSDDLYLQLSDSSSGPGVQALYRTCKSRSDYCGHQNNFARIDEFVDADRQAALVERISLMVQRERERKAGVPA